MNGSPLYIHKITLRLGIVMIYLLTEPSPCILSYTIEIDAWLPFPIFKLACKNVKIADEAKILFSFVKMGKNYQCIIFSTVPGDKSALNPSGVRLGTPPLTTRGLKEQEMNKVVEYIDQGN